MVLNRNYPITRNVHPRRNIRKEKMFHNGKEITIQDVVKLCDNTKEPLLFDNMVESFDLSHFVEYLKSGEKKKVKVQQYRRLKRNGYTIVEEEQSLPFEMYCKDFCRYYDLCSPHLDPGKEVLQTSSNCWHPGLEAN